jgi:long-chain acyl-CoA synthetase
MLPDGTIWLGDRSVAKPALGEDALRAAAGLRALGIGGGDVVAVFMRNDFPFPTAVTAANLAGAYATPINWHLRGDEVSAILADCRAAALVIQADLLPVVEGHVPEGTRLIVAETPVELAAAYGQTSTPVPDGFLNWQALIDDNAPLADPVTGRFTMIYTSGTTAQPKGVTRAVTDPEMLALGGKYAAEMFGLRPGMSAALTGPVYHSATYSYMTSSLRLEGDLTLMPRFDAEELLRLVELRGLSHMHMVPTMFTRLLRLPEEVRSRHDLGSLEHIIHGAAPCPPEVKRAMIEWWGPVIWEYYGSTEASISTIIGSQDWLERPGSVGPLFEGREVEIRNDGGDALPVGEQGEIFIKLTDNTAFSYRNRPDLDPETQGGVWFSNGDVGYFDGDGFLYLCDRAKDMIISGGVNIFPSEIEAVIIGHPQVRDCAVFGIPDPEYGEAIAAAVEADGDVTSEAIQALVTEKLARYKAPRVVEFHDSLPREDSGKIFKRKLRDPFWEGQARKI